MTPDAIKAAREEMPSTTEFRAVKSKAQCLREHGEWALKHREALSAILQPAPSVDFSEGVQEFARMLDVIKLARSYGKAELTEKIDQHIERWERILAYARSRQTDR